MNKFILLLFITAQVSFAQKRGQLWGATRDGGIGNGVIYKIDTAGNQKVAYEFPYDNKGYFLVNGFCENSDGKLYGATFWGGSRNCGAIICYDVKAGTYTKKADFTGKNGEQPAGSLVLAANGKFYGLTNKGGRHGGGTLFEFDPIKNRLVTKIHFKNSIGYGAFGALTMGADGLIYGTTFQGGKNNDGVLFAYDPVTTAYKVKFNFNSETGNTPCGSMVERNKKLYGLTNYGNGACFLFEFDLLKNKYTKKLVFPEGVGARYSCNGMILHDGKIYGAAHKDFAPNSGFIFQYDADKNKLKILKNFGDLKNGNESTGKLVSGSNGKLYGINRTTLSYTGLLYEFDPSTLAFKILQTFSEKIGGPAESIMQASNGKIYGATLGGGRQGMGGIFEFDIPSHQLRTPCWFYASPNGEQLNEGILLAKNNKLYGLMGMGGNKNYGVLIAYDPVSKKLSKKIDFNDQTGRAPYGLHLNQNNGKLYGYTYYGGKYNKGTHFEFDPETNLVRCLFNIGDPSKTDTTTITTTHTGNELNNKFELPPSDVYFFILADIACNQKIYGIRSNGTYGREKSLVICEQDPVTRAITEKYAIDDYNVASKLIIGSDSLIYGWLKTNMPGKLGSTFSYDPTTGTFKWLGHFTGPNGARPCGDLFEIKP